MRYPTMRCPFDLDQEISSFDASKEPGAGGVLSSLSSNCPEVLLEPACNPIFFQASGLLSGMSTDKSSNLSYPFLSKKSGLKATPPSPLDVNSEGVLELATTCSPSTSTNGLSPPIRLSSFLSGVYLALYKSERTRPIFEQ